jgi:hypothetical protein
MCFWTVSIVLDSKKLGYHYVSETGSVPLLRCIKLRGEGKNGIKPQMGPLEGANLNHWTGLFCLYLRDFQLMVL